jgi:hypothetical protein
MRNLSINNFVVDASRLPKGLSFEIADLILIQGWAAFHNLHMSVRLDHGTDDEEYEEAVEFYSISDSLCRFIMWRGADAVFVQPLVGRKRRYGSVAEALDSLIPEKHTACTDIKAAMWLVD